jgi:MFS family permease
MQRQIKITLLSSISAGLEYYDFIIYAMLATYLAPLFFPQHHSNIARLEIFSVFALGYLVRPIGGCLFGHYGDRFGRKHTWIVSILLMAGSSLSIGVLPTYAQAGLIAPLLLVMLRVLQGLAMGAEMPGALTFLNEKLAASASRGLLVGCMIAGISLCAALGSWVSYGVAHLATAQRLSWGWRLPFIVGGLLAIMGYVVRRQLHETEQFICLKKNNQQLSSPLAVLLTRHARAVWSGFGLVLLPACCIMFNLFLPSFAHVYYHYRLSDISRVMTLGLLWCALLLPLMGYISDKMGAQRLFIITTIILALLMWPLFVLLSVQTASSLLVFMLIYQTFVAVLAVCYMTMLANYFPASVRYSGIAMCYNVVFSLVGLMPLLLTLLIHIFHGVSIVTEYFIVVTVIALVAVSMAPTTVRHSQS